MSLYQIFILISQTIPADLKGPKKKKNTNCTMVDVRETFYGPHTVQHQLHWQYLSSLVFHTELLTKPMLYRDFSTFSKHGQNQEFKKKWP